VAEAPALEVEQDHAGLAGDGQDRPRVPGRGVRGQEAGGPPPAVAGGVQGDPPGVTLRVEEVQVQEVDGPDPPALPGLDRPAHVGQGDGPVAALGQMEGLVLGLRPVRQVGTAASEGDGAAVGRPGDVPDRAAVAADGDLRRGGPGQVDEVQRLVVAPAEGQPAAVGAEGQGIDQVVR